MKQIATRTAVIGSGCAGLNAADWLAALGEDCLLITDGFNRGTSRNTGSDKQTYYRLSLAGDDGDSVGAMAQTGTMELTYSDVEHAMTHRIKPAFLEMNRKALKYGAECVK